MTDKEKENVTKAAQTAGANAEADEFQAAVMRELARMTGEAVEIKPRQTRE
jgi:hypothetical protein